MSCHFSLWCMSLSCSSLAYVSIQRGLFKGFQGSALCVLDCALKHTVFQLTFVSKDVRLTIRASQSFSSPSVLLVELKSKGCHEKCNFLTAAFFYCVYHSVQILNLPLKASTNCPQSVPVPSERHENLYGDKR